MASEDGLGKLRQHLGERPGRLYLGTAGGGLVFSDPEQAVLVLGPPRAGKTTSVAIPNVLAAPHAVISASTKPDVMAATLATRAALGPCWLLDPTGSVRAPAGVTRLRWSPVAASGSWEDALVLARAMSRAARPDGQRGDTAHWTERAEALLAPLLHAAALADGDMRLVVRWVLRQDLDAPGALLAGHGADLAADVVAGLAATDPRELSGIWSSTAGLLAAYRSEVALAEAAAPNLDPRRLARSGDAVYICAPARQQQLVAPIVVAFLEEVRAGAYEANAAGAPGPVTFVLDELANIAPLPDLPAMVAEGGGQGLLTLACLQDLSQARQRWGPAADGFLSLFGTKVVLPGIGDLGTLDLVSRLAGEVDVQTRSVSRSPWWASGRGAETVSWSARRQRRLPLDAVRHQPPGSGLVLIGARPPERVGLPPWWAVAPFAEPGRSRAAGRAEPAGPGDSPAPGRAEGRSIG